MIVLCRIRSLTFFIAGVVTMLLACGGKLEPIEQTPPGSEASSPGVTQMTAEEACNRFAARVEACGNSPIGQTDTCLKDVRGNAGALYFDWVICAVTQDMSCRAPASCRRKYCAFVRAAGDPNSPTCLGEN